MSDALLATRRETLASLQRRHIVEGFAAAATEKGYAGATITDIVRIARVSKSTLYEHFADKEAIYLHLHQLCREAIDVALRDSLARTAQELDWHARVRDLVRSRLEVTASDPAFLGQSRIEGEVPTAGARAAREVAGRQFAALYVRLSEELAATTPDVAPIPEHVALAGLAANALFIGAVAAQGPDAVRGLEGPLTDVWIRLLRA